MKRKFIIWSFTYVLFILGCSTNELPEEPPIIVDDNTSYKIGVDKWDEENFISERYYNLIDTIGEIKLQPSVVVKYQANDKISVAWKINSLSVPNAEIHKEWLPDYQIWLSANNLNLDGINLNFGDNIKATILINDSIIIREAKITEKKIVTDVLGVNFGMSKEDVSEKELNRAGKYVSIYASTWREYLPNLAVLWFSSNIQDGITIYRFTNDKLSGIGEYTTKIEYSGSLADYCRLLGLKETPQITESGTLDKSYVWNNGKIEFTLSIIDDAPVVGLSDTCKAIGVSYRKLN